MRFILPVNGGESMTILISVLLERELPILSLFYHSEKNRQACVVSAHGKSSFQPSLTQEGYSGSHLSAVHLEHDITRPPA